MMRVLKRMILAVPGLSPANRRESSRPARKFGLESLESRILLSTDVIPVVSAPTVINEQLDAQPLIEASLDLLASLDLDQTRLESARDIKIEVQDLPGWTIAETVDDTITIDSDAAGF